MLINVCFVGGENLFNSEEVKVVVKLVEERLVGKGCILLCKLGIELFICVMVECEDVMLV